MENKINFCIGVIVKNGKWAISNSFQDLPTEEYTLNLDQATDLIKRMYDAPVLIYNGAQSKTLSLTEALELLGKLYQFDV